MSLTCVLRPARSRREGVVWVLAWRTCETPSGGPLLGIHCDLPLPLAEYKLVGELNLRRSLKSDAVVGIDVAIRQIPRLLMFYQMVPR
jgi:hypothetical protein